MKHFWKIFLTVAVIIVATVFYIVFSGSPVNKNSGNNQTAIESAGGSATSTNQNDDVDSLVASMEADAETEAGLVKSDNPDLTDDSETLNNFNNIYDANQF